MNRANLGADAPGHEAARRPVVRCIPAPLRLCVEALRTALFGGWNLSAVWLCASAFLAFSPRASASTNDAFARGLEAFQTGRFSDAATALREAAARQPASGTLVNLGLAEWRRGRAGTAIQAWERALWIDPHDARAKANLAYARHLTGVESPDLAWYERASTWLPVNAWAWIAGVSLWLAVGMAILPGVFRWRRAGWQQALAALSFAVFLLSLPAHAGVVTRTRIGFALKKDTPLRFTPTTDAETNVKLNAGQPLRAARVRGDYIFVRTTHGQGWIERSQFGSLCRD